MILGTSSGSGKSLLTAAICGFLKGNGEFAVPFKGQNMSNNAWIDKNGGEMAYSQVFQAWAAEIDPICLMNPVLIKPQGDCISEIVHLGKSIGVTKAQNYYEEYFSSGWDAITKGLKKINKLYPEGRLIIEGAGSPVEVNLQHKDLTNLRLAKHLKANCILVADIERGGVFAQLIGTLELLKPNEKKLIKGIIINKFRGDLSLFDSGRKWIEEKTNIPVLGVMPWLPELFPAEDSLDLVTREKQNKSNADLEIGVLKLNHLSNYSDLEPLESEKDVKLTWINPGELIGTPDALIIPGSKQTLKDLEILKKSGTAQKINDYANKGGSILGICGGMQMLGEVLEDPLYLESDDIMRAHGSKYKGLNLLPIQTTFTKKKLSKQRQVKAIWPAITNVNGFELHRGVSKLLNSNESINSIFADQSLGWSLKNGSSGNISGTYLHGILDNGEWRTLWINELRKNKKLAPIKFNNIDYHFKRKVIIKKLVDAFGNYIDINKFNKLFL